MRIINERSPAKPLRMAGLAMLYGINLHGNRCFLSAPTFTLAQTPHI